MTTDTDDQKPDPALDAIRAKLVRFFVINAVFLVAAVMVVVGAIVYKGMQKPRADSPRPAAPGVPGEVASAVLALPAGAKLLAASASGDRLVLDVALANGEREIRVHDAVSGALVGQYRIVSQ